MQDVRAERSVSSVRSEAAYKDWLAVAPSDRPLSVAHAATAKHFDGLMHTHWLRGEEAYSNVAVARASGIDEKHVRQWRTGEKRIPLAALLTMPPTLANAIVTWIGETRGFDRQQRALTSLATALDRVDAPVRAEDRDEVLRGLRDARDRIIARLDALAMGAK